MFIKKIERIIKRLSELFKRSEYKKSYSQSGEDLIVAGLLKSFRIHSVSYIDIGANDPVHLNNTYFFYENGHSGICIEPNPLQYIKLKHRRERDVILNLGVGPGKVSSDSMPFYLMEPDTLSTFSKEGAERLVEKGHAKIKETQAIVTENINQIIEKYNKGVAPHFISLDVEGLDIEILNTFNFNKFRPLIFCIETLTFSPKRGEGSKITEIFDIMNKNNYIVYADTHINTIFVDKRADK